MRSRVVLVWTGLLVMFFAGRLMTTDVVAQYQVAESVFGGRDLFTSDYGWTVSGVRSDSYVPHAPGYSLILLPAAGLGLLINPLAGKVAGALTNALMSIVLVVGYKRLAQGFMGELKDLRFLGVLVGTMALVYGRMPYDVTSATALAIWGAWFMHTGKSFHAGILFGASLFVRPDMIVMLPIYWTDERNLEKFTHLLAGAIPFILAIFAYNHYRFGSIFNDGHSQDPAIAFNLYSRGIPGLLFSPGKGLFWYAPLTVIAIFHCGDWRFWSPFAFSLALHGFLHDWTGGTGWGPRFLFPILPVLFMPLVRSKTGGKLFTALAILSFTIAVFACVTDTNSLERSLGEDDYLSQSRQTLIWSPGRSPLLNTLIHPEVHAPDLIGYTAAGWPGAAAQLLAGGGIVLYALMKRSSA